MFHGHLEKNKYDMGKFMKIRHCFKDEQTLVLKSEQND